MNSYFVSLIRTWVPIVVGSALGWLNANYDILIPEDASSSLVIGVTAVLIGAYYAVARLLEKRFPWLGKLLVGLGAGSDPKYTAPDTATVRARSGPAPY